MRPLDCHQEQGFRAFLDNTPDCPWPEDSIAAAGWRKGYHNIAFEIAREDGDSNQEVIESDEDLHAGIDLRRAISLAKMAMPDLATCEAAVGFPTSEWVMRCHEVATLLLRSGVLDEMQETHGRAVAAYGLYRGGIAPGSPFARTRQPRHGWIEFSLGLVVDPTRWVFENGPPEIWVGTIGDYDFGACELRQNSRLNRRAQPPTHRGDVAQHRWDGNDIDITRRLDGMLRDGGRLVRDRTMTQEQAHWLANTAPQTLSDIALPLVGWLDRQGLGCLLPGDVRDILDLASDVASRREATPVAAMAPAMR